MVNSFPILSSVNNEILAHQQNALEKGNGKNDKNQFPQANEIQSYAETTDGSDDEFHDCEGDAVLVRHNIIINNHL